MKLELEDIHRLDIKPGEILVARVPDSAPLDECLQIKDHLTAALPGVRILVTAASVDFTVLNPHDLALATQDHPAR